MNFKSSCKYTHQSTLDELQGNVILQIIDVNGKLVKKESYGVSSEAHKIEMNELTDGIYFYSISVNEKLIKSSKLVIIK